MNAAHLCENFQNSETNTFIPFIVNVLRSCFIVFDFTLQLNFDLHKDKTLISEKIRCWFRKRSNFIGTLLQLRRMCRRCKVKRDCHLNFLSRNIFKMQQKLFLEANLSRGEKFKYFWRFVVDGRSNVITILVRECIGKAKNIWCWKFIERWKEIQGWNIFEDVSSVERSTMIATTLTS